MYLAIRRWTSHILCFLPPPTQPCLHQPYFLPFIVAGKANATGASAMRTGLNLAYRCEWQPTYARADWCATAAGPANRTPNDVWTSALRTVGALSPTEVFGDPGIGASPLPGLWT